MIIVTGSNGQLGRAIVRHLVNRVSAEGVVASVRDVGAAKDLEDLGVEVRHADFADPASLDSAFTGAERVLIVSVDKLGEEALSLHRAAIDAARGAGARRILYTSHMGARDDSPFAPAAQHAGTESDLEASGVRFTSLRHGFYSESCLHMIGADLARGELRVPADGPVSWTARSDLAQADAGILAANDGWDGITPPLTATEAVTMADIAALASDLLGRTIRRTVVSDEEWVRARSAAGIPAMYAELLLGTFRAARRGDFAATDPALEALLRRRPRSRGRSARIRGSTRRGSGGAGRRHALGRHASPAVQRREDRGRPLRGLSQAQRVPPSNHQGAERGQQGRRPRGDTRRLRASPHAEPAEANVSVLPGPVHRNARAALSQLRRGDRGRTVSAERVTQLAFRRPPETHSPTTRVK